MARKESDDKSRRIRRKHQELAQNGKGALQRFVTHSFRRSVVFADGASQAKPGLRGFYNPRLQAALREFLASLHRVTARLPAGSGDSGSSLYIHS